MKSFPNLFSFVSISIVVLVIFVFFFFRSVFFTSLRNSGGQHVTEIPSTVLWNQDGLKISSGVLSGLLYDTENPNIASVNQQGVVFTYIEDGDSNNNFSFIQSGDVMMHVDFVNDGYIGINVTDSVGRLPTAFVFNRKTREFKVVTSNSAGLYLAGAHNGLEMLMMTGTRLSLATLDKRIKKNLPDLKVHLDGFNDDFRPFDAAFSPDDKYILVTGVGYLEGSEGRDGERTVAFMLNVEDGSVVQIGEFEGSLPVWESNVHFVFMDREGEGQKEVENFWFSDSQWIRK